MSRDAARWARRFCGFRLPGHASPRRGRCWLAATNSGAAVQAAAAASPETTASVAPETAVGVSGLPLPRFVSPQGRQDECPPRALERASGAWVFQRKGLPVEIIAEFENWRRIRDSDGEEGWVYQSMLVRQAHRAGGAMAKKELTIAAAPHAGRRLGARRHAQARASSLNVEACDGNWCEHAASRL